jgi:uncharacterized membrane protein
MSSNDTAFFLRALGFGALAGSRSLSPPAMLSLYLARRSATPDDPAAQRLSSPTAVVALNALALGELAADKFPQAPNRTFPPAPAAARSCVRSASGQPGSERPAARELR